MGVELKPQNIVTTDGPMTDPPATGLGSISNLGAQRQNCSIVESVKNVCLGHATSADSASENWAGLQKVYQTKDIMNKCHPRKQYVNYSMKEGADIKSPFHEFKLFLEQLASVGVKYTDDDNVETMLSSPQTLMYQ